ncbi:MAG: hypothetical protein ACFCU8_07025 [Thermosynechococcaceae cyanobacterium]
MPGLNFLRSHQCSLFGSLPLAIVLFATSACSQQAPDVTDRLEVLGNPMASDGKTGRALNVWDLQSFGGKIYVAGGSTTQNSGPINVWAYSPNAQQGFVKEFTVNEEAIEQFRVFGSDLYIPAADPKRGDTHKFYRRSLQAPWKLYQSPAPALAHVRDLLKTPSGDIILVGNNRSAIKDPSRPGAAVTRDQGASFQGAGLEQSKKAAANWFFSIFSYQGSIYAPTSLLRDADNQPGVIGIYDPKRQRIELSPTLKSEEFIPRIQLGSQIGPQGADIIYRLWQPVEYNSSLVYPVRSYSYTEAKYQSAYLNSIGFYVKRNMGATPSSVIFPDRKSIGEDTLIINDELYVLTNAKVSSEKFWVYVYKTKTPTDLQSWQEVLRFESRNKARSFEYLDQSFYFGLGQDHNDLIGDSGRILRVSL